MPVWATKKIRMMEWVTVHYRFEVLYLQLRKPPLHMAMLRYPGPLGEPDEIFLLVPDVSMMLKFPDFVIMPDHTGVPTNCLMMVGDQESFGKLYPELAGAVLVLPQATATLVPN